jgi:CBS domain-containing protein
MKVESILRRKGAHVETVTSETTVSTAVWSLRTKGIGALVVSDDGRSIQGVFSERDVVRALAAHGGALLGMRVAQVMSPVAVTCTPEDTVQRLMAEMTRRRVRHIPVVDEGGLRGIVSIGDVVKHRLDELEMEANVLRETLIVRH